MSPTDKPFSRSQTKWPIGNFNLPLKLNLVALDCSAGTWEDHLPIGKSGKREGQIHHPELLGVEALAKLMCLRGSSLVDMNNAL